MEAEARFPAMGSEVHVIVVDGPLCLLDTARGFVEELEDLWSRFRSASEVSRLNDLAGHAVPVSMETLSLVEHALEGARMTEGRYDPTVLGALLRAGYDRSFEQLTDALPRSDSMLGFGYDGIVVDVDKSTVTIPSGVGFDPGGIGKGYAADLLVGGLMALGAAGVCANVGGDLRVAGEAPGGGPWTIAVEHPMRPHPAAMIGLASGAVATSTRARRTWGPRNDRRHHLIDPATGLPASGRVVSATVVAAESWQAEVLAKAAFIAGLPDGLALLTATDTDGLLIDDRGSVHESPGLLRFTGGRRPVNESMLAGMGMEGTAR
jgi:FAD:protein FMN transferase